MPASTTSIVSATVYYFCFLLLVYLLSYHGFGSKTLIYCKKSMSVFANKMFFYEDFYVTKEILNLLVRGEVTKGMNVK